MTNYEGKNPNIRNIGVLTSGGDAPGMNAAVRAVVRVGLDYGYGVYGVRRGYHGLWRGDIIQLQSKDVSGVLQRGGTFLMTARSDTFMTEEGLQKAKNMVDVFNLGALVVIGGDGTFRGAKSLADLGVPVIGIPCTIDNDIASTEYTIGFDTAFNTAMEAIDKIKDTTSSHERCSVVEVMGRDAGYLALAVGISTGAEVILIPEDDWDFNQDLMRRLLYARNHGKNHYVVIVAEGSGSADDIAKRIEAEIGIESRSTILGHMQRGGNPSARDRFIASVMGAKAVESINEGKFNQLITLQHGEITTIGLEEGLAMTKKIDEDIIEVAKLIAI